MANKRMGFVALAVVLAIVGILGVLHSMGYLNFELPFTSTVATAAGTGEIGLKVDTDFKRQTFLSTVAQGATYTWRITASNTGDLTWNNAWITVRLGVAGSSVTQKTESGVIGSFLVEQCSGKIDSTDCRENPTFWLFQYSDDNGQTWKNGICTNGVCSIPVQGSLAGFGQVAKGTSKTVQFKMTVPTDAEKGQTRPLITNLIVRVDSPLGGVVHAVDGKSDQVTVGSISGSLALEFLGALLALLAAIALFIVA